MKEIEFDTTYGFGSPSYGTLIESFEVEVLLEVSDDDYQGDSRYLLREGERHGLLFFGWGSCSGCDALEGCTSPVEVIELRDQLWNSIHWEPSKSDLLRYVTGKDWPLEYSYHANESREFLAKATVLLGGEL